MPTQIQPRTECRPCRWYASLYNEGADTYTHICRLKGTKDPKPCKDFEREPGSDDE